MNARSGDGRPGHGIPDTIRSPVCQDIDSGSGRSRSTRMRAVKVPFPAGNPRVGRACARPDITAGEATNRGRMRRSNDSGSAFIVARPDDGRRTDCYVWSVPPGAAGAAAEVS